MRFPRLDAGIEQGYVFACLRISRDYASALAKGARDAGEREILHCCLSSGNQWYDMVDVKGGFLTRLTKAAILASISCPLDHLPAQGGRNGHGPGVF
jgi:hypothetical protein